jgi:CBS domain-containing protein
MAAMIPADRRTAGVCSFGRRSGDGVVPPVSGPMVEAAQRRGLVRYPQVPMDKPTNHASEVDRPESPEAITQATLIRDVQHLLRGGDPIVVRTTDSLQRLAASAVENTSCRVLSVVDDEERLVGLVPVRVLVNDIFLKIVPEEFLGEIMDVDAVLKYAKHIGARTAADIMVEPVALHEDDTVRDAFEAMHKAKLNGVPIIDEQTRVTGYLDQLELVIAWVDATRRSPLLRPSPESSNSA